MSARAIIEQLLENIEPPPEASCSCHVNPPCNDCVDHSGLREAIADARAFLAKPEPAAEGLLRAPAQVDQRQLFYDLIKIGWDCPTCDGDGTIWPGGQARTCPTCNELREARRKHCGHGYISMDMYSKRGTKVRFSNGSSGYGHDQKRARQHVLELGHTYTVDRTEVGESSSQVYLQERPGIAFNTVMFEHLPDGTEVAQPVKVDIDLGAAPSKTVYLFWHRRPNDKQAWPVVYESKDLAESCKFRIGPVVPVRMPTLPPEGEAKQDQRVEAEAPQGDQQQDGQHQEPPAAGC